MRARMGLVMAGVSFDIIEVDLKNKPPHMIEISPKGTVPVLSTSNTQVIDESLDIIKWAGFDDLNMNLISQNDGAFKHALDRYKYPARYVDEDCSGARDQGEAFLKVLNDYVSIDKTTITDICIFPFIRQFSNVDREWFDGLPYLNLQKWLAYHIDSDLFKTIMDKKFLGA
jgi:glutathione S-transferase